MTLMYTTHIELHFIHTIDCHYSKMFFFITLTEERPWFCKESILAIKIKHNSYRKLQHLHFISRCMAGKDTLYNISKERLKWKLVLYCSDNTKMKKNTNISQNIFRIYKYKKVLEFQIIHKTKKGWVLSTNTTDKQTKLLNSTKNY